MAPEDSPNVRLTERYEERERREQVVRQARARLKQACRAAYQDIPGSSQQAAQSLGLSATTVRQLASDGEKGWREPSIATCRKIDEYLRRTTADPGLTALREEFDRAVLRLRAAEKALLAAESAAELAEAARDLYAGELESYLLALSESLGETQRWTPYQDLEQGFEQRKVKVAAGAPERDENGNPRYGPARAPFRGEVSWEQAVKHVPIAVLLADAGYGKTWLLRHHCRVLCERALQRLRAGADPETVEIPLWAHAADLARRWDEDLPPRDCVVRAAMMAPRARGFSPTAEFRGFLAGRVSAASTRVLVDACDEIFSDRLRGALGEALSWLGGLAAPSGLQLILTSRHAGYADPFRPGTAHRPRYYYLGILDEHQVRRLWARWFEFRSLPVPERRLDAVFAPGSPLSAFVCVPLIAAFCAWVAEDEAVEGTRAGLYGQVVRKFVAQVWKAGTRDAGNPAIVLRQDPARRSQVHAALEALAWDMAAGGPEWRDAVGAAESENVLAATGLPASAGVSRTWEVVRVVGILVPATSDETGSGESPLLWIHHSLHEYLAARRLVTRTEDELRELLADRAWLSREWGNVLDFALGLEAVPEHGDPRATRVLRDLATGGGDGLGWFATVFMTATDGVAPDRELWSPVIERTWRLQRAGFASLATVARVLALTPGSDPDALVPSLFARVSPGANVQELWDALAWSGPAGRAALAEVVRTGQVTAGALTALHRVDGQAAVAALRDRVAGGLPLSVDASPVLRELGDDRLGPLLGAYRAEPSSVGCAQSLGWTKLPRARAELMERLRRPDPDPLVRLAAVKGLFAWYGYEFDAEGLDLLVRLAASDPDADVGLQARVTLETVATGVPWVRERIGETLPRIHGALAEPPATSPGEIAAHLYPFNPATYGTLARLDPALVTGPVATALERLGEQALRGEVGDDPIVLIAGLLGPAFVDRAFQALHEAESPHLEHLALAVGELMPASPQAFEAMAVYAGRHPGLLVEAGLRAHGSDRAQRVLTLLRLLVSLEERRRKAVEIWAPTARALLLELPPAERREFRTLCAQVTVYLTDLLEPE
ncbi:hypothetical protein Aph01nite_33580 [Acrocarpospora phusangensis]|uniref:Uncharacterized protein n=1 Tax=Acrocarpospora phusangensis TaxID=1070424 RepID=A0A919QCS3_9ACTN|nr:HEAT repeat domain-containing protein [Acrocarpospora phusangensis]GIH25048.1 hypothetical protein Aph01nite_33580 [Acrocarpospora phusangensis]